jgi:hypothetical protein
MKVSDGVGGESRDLPQKLLPSKCKGFRNRMYFPSFFKFTTCGGDISPEKPRHGAFADNLLGIGIWVRSRWSREALDPQFEVRLLPELIS